MELLDHEPRSRRSGSFNQCIVEASPENRAYSRSRQVASQTCDRRWRENQKEQADCTCTSAGILSIDFTKREGEGRLEQGVCIGETVEYGDEKQKASQKAHDVLPKTCAMLDGGCTDA